jgi:hypothetical protein
VARCTLETSGTVRQRIPSTMKRSQTDGVPRFLGLMNARATPKEPQRLESSDCQVHKDTKTHTIWKSPGDSGNHLGYPVKFDRHHGSWDAEHKLLSMGAIVATTMGIGFLSLQIS